MAFSFRVLYDRITDQHFLMKDVFGGNYHAPMDLAFKRVFENGCGAGDWSLVSEFSIVFFVPCGCILPGAQALLSQPPQHHIISTTSAHRHIHMETKGIEERRSWIDLILSV